MERRSPSDSLAALLHAHAYTLDRQIVDGAFTGQVDEDSTREPEPGSSSDSSRRLRIRSSLSESARPRADAKPTTWTPPPASSFFIPALPGLDPASTLTLFAGHIPSTITSKPLTTTIPADSKSSSSGSSNAAYDNAHLFFLLAKARHIAEREKLVLWLNGGPGCSSFDGALMEIGPLRMVQGKKGQLEEQEGSWNEYANVLFLDQPAGTGYSYVNGRHFVHSGDEAAQQIITFLRNFYDVFPEYERMDLYIAGESFAGIWIPYLADALLKTTIVKPSLKGLLIGNGWIDPYNQYPAYIDFARTTKLVAASTTADQKVQNAHDLCEQRRQKYGKDKFPINDHVCEMILSTITETTMQMVNGKTYCVNNYDIRLTDTHPACGMNWPNLLPDMYAYLPRKDVVSAFHASAKTAAWVECNGHVADSFWARTKPSVSLLPGIMEAGVPVLLFSGMQDLICNHVGTERLIDNLNWAGETGFGNNTESLDWFVDGKSAGTWTTARNLTYVQVYNASHMVPFDLPVVAHDMFSRFTSTDYISAAGAAALVPSRIGNEQEAIVGETHPNGTALDGTSILGLEDSVSAGSSSTSSRSAAGSPLSDAYYNIGAALLVLFIFISLGTCFIYRQRRRRRSVFSKGLPMHGFQAVPAGNGSHRRKRSSADGRRQSRGQSVDEETNELLPIDNGQSRTGKRGNGTTAASMSEEDLPRGEALFSVGEDDEEEGPQDGNSIDSDEEGNLGRPGRKFSAPAEEVPNSRVSGSSRPYDAV